MENKEIRIIPNLLPSGQNCVMTVNSFHYTTSTKRGKLRETLNKLFFTNFVTFYVKL